MRTLGARSALPISVCVCEASRWICDRHGIEPGEDVLSRRDRCRCSVEMNAYDMKPLRGSLCAEIIAAVEPNRSSNADSTRRGQSPRISSDRAEICI